MLVGETAMTTLALQMNKNHTKLILYSVYAMLLSFMAAPPRQILYQGNLLAMANPNIQYGHVSRDVFTNKAGEELYSQTRMLAEKERWDESTKKRYKNGAILTVQPGVKHIRLVRRVGVGNVKINVVEINKKVNPNLEVVPVLAADTLSHKATIKTIAGKGKAIAAVNATYFKPQTGVPLGTLMIDKKIYTGPIYNRVALGIKPEGYIMDRYKLDANLKYKRISVQIDNINQPRMLSTYILVYTKDWGQNSPTAPNYGVNLAIEDGKITKISNGSLAIPENGFVVSGPKSKLEPFFNAQMKDEKQVFLASLRGSRKVELEIKNDKGWEDVKHIVSGGPFLVKNGDVYVDVKEQKLLSITGRNPRTAIGYTKDNEFIMITIDGREHSSVGMTLTETARLMKDFGCIWAMNLDGGGSSVMYIKGSIVNSPAVKGGIAVSNALAIREIN